MTATLDLLRAHQVVAELLVAEDLRVQHLDYHPALRHEGRTVQLTTVTVGVPSQPAALARWCQALNLTEVQVRRQDRDTAVTAEAEHADLRWRITTYLRGDARRGLHRHTTWHAPRTGTAAVPDLITCLTRAALDAAIT